MTFDTPSHRQILYLTNAVHGLNRAVTMLAFHACDDMRAVVEAGIGWQAVYLDPGDGSRLLAAVGLKLAVKTQTVIQLLEFGRDDEASFFVVFQRFDVLMQGDLPRSGHETMAIHAQVRRWNAGLLALFCPEVAIQAGDLQLARVQSVRKIKGLNWLVALLVSRQVIPLQSRHKGQRATTQPQYKNEGQQATCQSTASRKVRSECLEPVGGDGRGVLLETSTAPKPYQVHPIVVQRDANNRRAEAV